MFSEENPGHRVLFSVPQKRLQDQPRTKTPKPNSGLAGTERGAKTSNDCNPRIQDLPESLLSLARFSARVVQTIHTAGVSKFDSTDLRLETTWLRPWGSALASIVGHDTRRLSGVEDRVSNDDYPELRGWRLCIQLLHIE